MNVKDYDAFAVYFKALAHPIRVQILDMLRGGEICVCHIEAALGKRQAYVSQQLMLLREAGIVESRKVGLQVFYCLASPQIEAILRQLCGNPPPHHRLDDCKCPRCAVAPATERNRETC